MATLPLILSAFVILATTSADTEDPITNLLGRVYIKNMRHQKYLIFDPISVSPEPTVLLWNVPRTIPNQGGAWFHLVKSPNKEQVDYNLVGTARLNFTLCVALKRPPGEDNYHYAFGTPDVRHKDIPECRWKIMLSNDLKHFWLINRLYGGHLKAVSANYNVDPLRRRVFLVLKADGEDESVKWEIGRVVAPLDLPSDAYVYDYSYDYSYDYNYDDDDWKES